MSVGNAHVVVDAQATPRLSWPARIARMLSVHYAYMTEYRAELLLWALANSLSFILMGAWFGAAQRGTFAMGPVDVVRYFLCVFVVRQLTVVWVVWEMEAEISRGKLAHALLQPFDPAWRAVLAHVAERGARLPFTAGLVVLFFALYPPSFFAPRATDVASFVLVVVFAFGLRFLIQHTLGLVTFWTERASALEALTSALYMFLGGGIVPLDMLPDDVQTALSYTPFPSLIWLPAHALLGDLQPLVLVRGVVVMLAWAAALWLLNRMMWRRGLLRYSSMGA